MGSNKAGRPKRHRWVYLAIEAVRKSGDDVEASPTAAICAKRRALVKSIVATSNRGQARKVRVRFADDERSAVFQFKN